MKKSSCLLCSAFAVLIHANLAWTQGVVHIAPGTYQVDGSLELDGKSVEMRGYTAEGTNHIWEALNETGVALADGLNPTPGSSTVPIIQFSGNVDITTNSRIIMDGENSTIANLILDFGMTTGSNGIWIEAGAVSITGNVIKSGGTAVITNPNNVSVDGFSIENNWFLSSDGSAVVIQANTNTDQSIILSQNNIETVGGLTVNSLGAGSTVVANHQWWGSYAGPAGTDGGGRIGATLTDHSGAGAVVTVDPYTHGRYGWNTFKLVDANVVAGNLAVSWADDANSTTDADAVKLDDDHDGRSDELELLAGSDPLDPHSYPQATFAFGANDFTPTPKANKAASFTVTVSNVVYIADNLPLLLRATLTDQENGVQQMFGVSTNNPSFTGSFTTGIDGQSEYNPYGDDVFTLDYAVGGSTLGALLNDSGVESNYTTTFVSAGNYELTLSLVAYHPNGSIDLLLDDTGGVVTRSIIVEIAPSTEVFVALDWVQTGTSTAPTVSGQSVRSSYFSDPADYEIDDFIWKVNAFEFIQEAIDAVHVPADDD